MAELGALKDYGSSVAAVAVRDFLKSEAERKKAYQELQKILIKNDRLDWLKKRALPLPPIPLTPEQKEEFFECFELMDPDETGFVEAGKLISAFGTIGVSLFQRHATAKSLFYDNELGAGHATKLRCDDFIVIMSRALARETLEREGRGSRKAKQECFSFVEAMRALRRKKLIEALTAGGEQLEKVVEQLDRAREAAIQAELAELNAERHLDRERMLRKQELEHMASLPRQVLRQMSQAARRHALHAEVTKNEQVPSDDDSESEEARLQDLELLPERLLSTRMMMQQVQQEDRALKRALSRHNSFASLAHLVPKNLPKGSFENVVATVIASLHASRNPSDVPSFRSSIRGSQLASLGGSKSASLKGSRVPSLRGSRGPSQRGSRAVSRRSSRRGSDEGSGSGARPGPSSPPLMLQALKRLEVTGSRASNRSNRSRLKSEMSVRWGDKEDAGTDAQTELLWPTGTPKGDSRPASPFEVNTELSLSPSVNPRSTHASEDGAGAEGQGDENKRRQQRQQQQIQQQQQRQQQQRRQHLLQQQDPNPEAPAIEFQGFPTGSLQGTAQPDVPTEHVRSKARKRTSFHTINPEASTAASKAGIPGESRPESPLAAPAAAQSQGSQPSSRSSSRGGTPEPQAARPQLPSCLKISSPASTPPRMSASGKSQAAGPHVLDPAALDMQLPASTPLGRTTSTESSPFGRRAKVAPDELYSMPSPGAESTQISKQTSRLNWAERGRESRTKRTFLRQSKNNSVRIHNPFRDYESDEDEVFAFWRREQRARRRARLEAERLEQGLPPSPERLPGSLSSSETDKAAGLRSSFKGRKADSADEAGSWGSNGDKEASMGTGDKEGAASNKGGQPPLIPRWPGWVWVGGTKGWQKQKKRRTFKDLNHESESERRSRSSGHRSSSAARAREASHGSKSVGKGKARKVPHVDGGGSSQDAVVQQNVLPAQGPKNGQDGPGQDGKQKDQHGRGLSDDENKRGEHVRRGRQQGRVPRSAHAHRVEQLKRVGEDPLQAFKESINMRHASMATAGESRYTTSRIGRRLQAGGLAFFGHLTAEIMQQEERKQRKMRSSFAVSAPKIPQPADAWVQAITRPQSRIRQSVDSARSALPSRCSSASVSHCSHFLSARDAQPHPASARAATAPHTTCARQDEHSARASTAPLSLSRGLSCLAPALQEPADLDAGPPDEPESAAVITTATSEQRPDEEPSSSPASLGVKPVKSIHPLAASAPGISLSPTLTDQVLAPVSTAEDHSQTPASPTAPSAPGTHSVQFSSADLLASPAQLQRTRPGTASPTPMTQSMSGVSPARASTAAHAGIPGQVLAAKTSRASSARAALPHSPFMGPCFDNEPSFQYLPTWPRHKGMDHAHYVSSSYGSASRHARCVDGVVRTVEGLHQPVLDSSLVSTFPKRTPSAGPSPPGSPIFSPSRVRSRSSSPPSRPGSAAPETNTSDGDYFPWVKPGQFARFPERTAHKGQQSDTPEAAAAAALLAAMESSFNNVSKTGHSFRRVPASISRAQGGAASGGVGSSGSGGGGGDIVSKVPAFAHPPTTTTIGSSTSSPSVVVHRDPHQHQQHLLHPVRGAASTAGFPGISTITHNTAPGALPLAASANHRGSEGRIPHGSPGSTTRAQMLSLELQQPIPAHTTTPPDLRSLASSARGPASARSTHPLQHAPSHCSGSVHAGGAAPSTKAGSVGVASEINDDFMHSPLPPPFDKKPDTGSKRHARRASSPSGLSRHRTPSALSGMRLRGLRKWTSTRLRAPGGGLLTVPDTPLESLVRDMTSRSHGSLEALTKQPRASGRHAVKRRSTFSGVIVHTGTSTALGMGTGLAGVKKSASFVYCREAPSFSTNTRYRCEVDGCSSYSRQLSQALSMPFDMDDDADSSDSAEITSKGFSTNRSGSAISSTSKGVGAEARAEYSQSAAHFNESAIQEGTRRSSGSSSGEQEDRFDSGIFRASGSEGIQDEAYESPPIWMAGALSRLASPASGQRSRSRSRSRSRHASPERLGSRPQSCTVSPPSLSAAARLAPGSHATSAALTTHPPLLSPSTLPSPLPPAASVMGPPVLASPVPSLLSPPPAAHTSPPLTHPPEASPQKTTPSHQTLHLLPGAITPAAAHRHPPPAPHHLTDQHFRFDSPRSPRSDTPSKMQPSPSTAPHPLKQQPLQPADATVEAPGSPPLQQSAATAAHSGQQHRRHTTLSPPPSLDQVRPLSHSLAVYNALPFVQGVHKTSDQQDSMQDSAGTAERQQQQNHHVLYPAQGAGGKPAVEQLRSQACATAAAAAAAVPTSADSLDHVHVDKRSSPAHEGPVTRGGLRSPPHVSSPRSSPQSPRAPAQEGTIQQESRDPGRQHGGQMPTNWPAPHALHLSLQLQKRQHPRQHQHHSLLQQHTKHPALPDQKQAWRPNTALPQAQITADQKQASPSRNLNLRNKPQPQAAGGKQVWRPSTALPQPQTAQSAAAALAEMVRHAQQAEDAAKAEAARLSPRGEAPPLFWKQPAVFKSADGGDERSLKARLARSKKEAALGNPRMVDTHQVLVGGEVYTLLLRSDGTCYGKQRAQTHPGSTAPKLPSHKEFWTESLAEGIKAYAHSVASPTTPPSASEGPAMKGSDTKGTPAMHSETMGPATEGSATMGSETMSSVLSSSAPLVFSAPASAAGLSAAPQAPAHAAAGRPASSGPPLARSRLARASQGYADNQAASSQHTQLLARSATTGHPGRGEPLPASGAAGVPSAGADADAGAGTGTLASLAASAASSRRSFLDGIGSSGDRTHRSSSGASYGSALSGSALSGNALYGGTVIGGVPDGVSGAVSGGGTVLNGVASRDAWGLEELQQQQQHQHQHQQHQYQRQHQHQQELREQLQQQQRFAHALSRSMSARPARKWDKVMHNQEAAHAAASGKKWRHQEYDKAGPSAGHAAVPSVSGSMSRVFGGSRLRNASSRPNANSLFRSEPQPLWHYHRD